MMGIVLRCGHSLTFYLTSNMDSVFPFFLSCFVVIAFQAFPPLVGRNVDIKTNHLPFSLCSTFPPWAR